MRGCRDPVCIDAKHRVCPDLVGHLQEDLPHQVRRRPAGRGGRGRATRLIEALKLY